MEVVKNVEMDNKLGFWKMKNFSEGIDEGINDGYFEDPID